VFLFGNSLGAATAVTMCVQAPELYHGVILCCPFFQLFKKDQSKVAKMMPVAKIVQKVWPTFQVNVKSVKRAPKWNANWFEDPKSEGGYLSADTVVRAAQLIEEFQTEVLPRF
jgi:alpha-beta hydrolase superfamily lysophospholipase